MNESGPETVQRVLSSYEIGAKIRRLRRKKKIGLVDLGRHTGLSASMLSQLENGKLIPTLPTLARVAMVFDVSLEHFFGERKKRGLFSVVRARERIRFPEKAEAETPAWYFECLAYSAQEKSLQAYLAVIEPRKREEMEEHAHEGAEFLYVIEGELGVLYEEEETVLGEGDGVYFDASQPHGYRSVGEGQARALVVTTPPRL